MTMRPTPIICKPNNRLLKQKTQSKISINKKLKDQQNITIKKLNQSQTNGKLTNFVQSKKIQPTLVLQQQQHQNSPLKRAAAKIFQSSTISNGSSQITFTNFPRQITIRQQTEESSVYQKDTSSVMFFKQMKKQRNEKQQSQFTDSQQKSGCNNKQLSGITNISTMSRFEQKKKTRKEISETVCKQIMQINENLERIESDFHRALQFRPVKVQKNVMKEGKRIYEFNKRF